MARLTDLPFRRPRSPVPRTAWDESCAGAAAPTTRRLPRAIKLACMSERSGPAPRPTGPRGTPSEAPPPPRDTDRPRYREKGGVSTGKSRPRLPCAWGGKIRGTPKRGGAPWHPFGLGLRSMASPMASSMAGRGAGLWGVLLPTRCPSRMSAHFIGLPPHSSARAGPEARLRRTTRTCHPRSRWPVLRLPHGAAP